MKQYSTDPVSGLPKRESPWKYIDKWDKMTSKKCVYCDTQNFSINAHDEIPHDILGFLVNTKFKDSQLFRQDEILGFLKTLECENKESINNKGYFRFFKVGEIKLYNERKNLYCCWVGGFPHNIKEFKEGLINRTEYNPDNIIKDRDI